MNLISTTIRYAHLKIIYGAHFQIQVFPLHAVLGISISWTQNVHQDALHQNEEDKQKRPEQVPVNGLEITNTRLRHAYRAQQKHDSQYGCDTQANSITHVSWVQPEHCPTHHNHKDAWEKHLDDVITKASFKVKADGKYAVTPYGFEEHLTLSEIKETL